MRLRKQYYHQYELYNNKLECLSIDILFDVILVILSASKKNRGERKKERKVC